MGDPANELIRLAEERGADLIAMSTHGHRFLNDLMRGTTVNKVRTPREDSGPAPSRAVAMPHTVD